MNDQIEDPFDSAVGRRRGVVPAAPREPTTYEKATRLLADLRALDPGPVRTTDHRTTVLGDAFDELADRRGLKAGDGHFLHAFGGKVTGEARPLFDPDGQTAFALVTINSDSCNVTLDLWLAGESNGLSLLAAIRGS